MFIVTWPENNNPKYADPFDTIEAAETEQRLHDGAVVYEVAG